MEIEEKAEELLETLWIGTEESKEPSLPLAKLGPAERETVEQLTRVGYIGRNDDRLYLSDKGKAVARSVVRRHRLAERLLADVLGTGGMLMHEKACKFEHLLDRGLDESICNLLGHPKICPHGKPIPAGRCCQQARMPARKLVSSLSELTPGQKGKVAYVYAPESNQLQKLMAMGVLPGAQVTLVQNFPSYVFEIGQTQFAVDKEIAQAIYVRLVEPEIVIETEAGKLPERRKRLRFGPPFGKWLRQK